MAKTSQGQNIDARLPGRGARTAPVRQFGSHARDEDGAARSKTPFLSPTGWLIVTIFNIVLVILIGLSVVLVPPVLDCRAQSARGFFAGDSFQACASRGIAARFRDLEGGVRRIILRSGQ